ncbi:hypothetical protein M513_06950 [Trichuris suis]|uniref:WAP domain-containing protein n=1 Tax=Trichuris suis TaxID=68888 RepID=A0A085M4F9_9BILA|nr:hypothetical protein M513_06950 [Trichuris suis]
MPICLLQAVESAKIGRCPPRPFGAGRARFCSSDNQCPGRKKCCLVKQGYACTTPAFYYPSKYKPNRTKRKSPPARQANKLIHFTDQHIPPRDHTKPITRPSEKEKPGTCPPTNIFTGKAPFCKRDSDCEGSQKCCLTKAGNHHSMKVSLHSHTTPYSNSHCITTAQKAKPGTCPPYPFGPVGAAMFCQTDFDCKGTQKCCMTKVGYDCTPPAEETGPSAKPGTCPAYPFGHVGLAMFCQTDFDCKGTLKCCITSVGYNCTLPVEESQGGNKPGQCPAAPAITGKALLCRSDDDCDGADKCCLTTVGRTCVKPVEPRPVSKKGSCPPKPTGPIGLANFCESDFDCEASMKCCITSVGYDCTSPVEESLRPSKRGICPWPSSVMEKGRLCSSDGDCQGSRKCCPTKAGNACVKPVSEELAGGRGTCPPAAYVMGLPGSCRRDKDCEDGKKCCDGVDGKSCSVLVLAS